MQKKSKNQILTKKNCTGVKKNLSLHDAQHSAAIGFIHPSGIYQKITHSAGMNPRHPSGISNFIPYLALQTTCRPCLHEKTTLRAHPFHAPPAHGPTPHLVSHFFCHWRWALPFVQFQNSA